MCCYNFLCPRFTSVPGAGSASQFMLQWRWLWQDLWGRDGGSLRIQHVPLPRCERVCARLGLLVRWRPDRHMWQPSMSLPPPPHVRFICVRIRRTAIVFQKRHSVVITLELRLYTGKKTQHVLSIFKYLSSVSAFSANNVGKKFWFKVSGDENRIAIKVGTTKQGFYQTLHRVTIGLGTKAHILPYRTKSIILWPYLGIVSVFKNVNWVSTWHNTCILFDLILKINCRPSLPLLDTKIVSHIDYFIILLIYII